MAKYNIKIDFKAHNRGFKRELSRVMPALTMHGMVEILALNARNIEIQEINVGKSNIRVPLDTTKIEGDFRLSGRYTSTLEGSTSKEAIDKAIVNIHKLMNQHFGGDLAAEEVIDYDSFVISVTDEQKTKIYDRANMQYACCALMMKQIISSLVAYAKSHPENMSLEAVRYRIPRYECYQACNDTDRAALIAKYLQKIGK